MLLLACTTASLTSAATSGPISLPGTTGSIQVTPVYHGTVLMEGAGLRIWVDPWSKAAISGPAADLVLITDIHQDHLDPAALAKVVGPSTLVVAPAAVAESYKKVTTVLKNGEKTELKGISIEAVPMYNLVRGPKDGALYHEKGRGNGYILMMDGQRVYLAGDTECIPEMRALSNIDLALLPMNLPYTMTPQEAAECAAAFKPRRVTPYHYAGSKLEEFRTALASHPEIEIIERDSYPGGLPW
jgi:L-ascorbate metabolism protein UlaG (beta-lactamase superfamily)